MIEHAVAATIHGRVLSRPADGDAPWPVLIGFHGYAEPADIQLERLAAIPGSDRWLLVSIQGLHRFYRGRSEEVVASWMTRQNRELAIGDNVAYVASVLDALRGQYAIADRVVLAGFSQGVATAFRAAPRVRARGVVALGGDVPPDVDAASLARIPAVLLGRGRRDGWYTQEKLDADVARLRAAGSDLTVLVTDAGHEWTDEFSRGAGEFLERVG